MTTALSRFEDRLTRWIRHPLDRYPRTTLRGGAFVIALFLCLSAGLILLFLLFGPLLAAAGFSQIDINTIALLSALGMYLLLPVLGAVADRHGPVLLLALLVVLFVPLYFVLARAFAGHWSALAIGVCFAAIGCATSSLYFLLLLTCARIYPHHRGLAISAPVACYGLSSLLGAQMLKILWFSSGSELNLTRVFYFFSALYLVVGSFNFLAATVVLIERDKVFDTETLPLLVNDEPATSPANRYMAFLKDRSAWLVLLLLFLNLGPHEMYINNMLLVLTTTSGPDFHPLVPNMVLVHAAASTIARLAVGWVLDWVVARGISRMYLLVSAVGLGAIATHTIANGPGLVAAVGGNAYALLVLVMMGALYGGIFTVYPAVVASVWGLEMMGSTWGLFMVAPALASTGYLMAYARVWDRGCGEAGDCLRGFFTVCSVGYVASALVLVVAWYLWTKRRVGVL